MTRTDLSVRRKRKPLKTIFYGAGAEEPLKNIYLSNFFKFEKPSMIFRKLNG